MSTATTSTGATTARKVRAYTVRAVDPKTGQVITEKIDATSEEQARAAMSLRGLTALAVKAKGTGLNTEIPALAKRVKAEDLAVFARMFSVMLDAGVPMLQTMDAITRNTENPTLKGILERVTASVQAGSSLSQSLAEHPNTFPPLMINMVRAGEVGGFLDHAMRQIAESTEADVKLRSEIKSAATYPVVVLIMGVVAAVGMLLFIVPVFANMFQDLGGELPWPTRILVDTSNVLKVAALPAVPVGIAAVIWWRRNKHTVRVRRVVDPWRLKLPVFGPLVTKIAIGRFARNLSVMLSSGVQMLSALEVVGETAGNFVISDVVATSAEHVKQGEALSAHLGDNGAFPDMVVAMIRTGEESGSVDTMLAKIADFYDDQVSATTKKLASLIEPLLIAFIGVMVGSMIIAMYMPIFKVFDLIQ